MMCCFHSLEHRLLPFHRICLVRLEAYEAAFPKFPFMNNMICLCKYVSRYAIRTSITLIWVLLTGGQHALNKVIDVTEYYSEALWCALLTSQRLDLHTLQHWLGDRCIGIVVGVKDSSLC